jgi:hypothetical protein
VLKNLRRRYAMMVRDLVRGALPKQLPLSRKEAIFRVREELRASGFPCSRRTIYRWMSEFSVSLQ